mmetsp:Transcript_19055/g.55350  ORF Transcript_19055/g.55350 Transcript_19055/m.55350 type:complete len:312 (+) Transcript_19055:1927-2862(+)
MERIARGAAVGLPRCHGDASFPLPSLSSSIFSTIAIASASFVFGRERPPLNGLVVRKIGRVRLGVRLGDVRVFRGVQLHLFPRPYPRPPLLTPSRVVAAVQEKHAGRNACIASEARGSLRILSSPPKVIVCRRDGGAVLRLRLNLRDGAVNSPSTRRLARRRRESRGVLKRGEDDHGRGEGEAPPLPGREGVAVTVAVPELRLTVALLRLGALAMLLLPVPPGGVDGGGKLGAGPRRRGRGRRRRRRRERLRGRRRRGRGGGPGCLDASRHGYGRRRRALLIEDQAVPIASRRTVMRTFTVARSGRSRPRP